MSQAATFGVPSTAPATPTVFASRANNSLDALLSMHSGSSAPSYAVTATTWADTAVAGTISVKQYDGASWRLIWSVNTSTGKVTYYDTGGVRADAAQSLDQAQRLQARENVGATLLGGTRNKLINPLGTINQRSYVSGTNTSGANQYTLDRWRVVTSGQNLSWTESAGVRTMTAPAGGVEQIVEGAALITGDHVLNWEGTATATVNGTARTKGEVFSLTGGSNATVRFVGGTFAKPLLEEGGDVTDFAHRHNAQEESLCLRYCWLLPSLYVVSGGVTTVTFPTTMYRIPTWSGGGSGFTVGGTPNARLASLFQSASAYQTLIADAEIS